MKKEDFLALSANPDLIPGIYNYCDQWCERCAFTSRCLNYLSRQTDERSPEEEDINSEAYWEKISESFSLTHELLDDMAREHGIDLDHMEEEGETLLQERKAQREVTAQTSISLLAWQYLDLGNRWLDQSQTPLKQKEEELNQSLRLGLPGNVAHEDAKAIANAMEVVAYYVHQIYIKLMRAQSAREDDDAWFEENDFPKDSDGSAKVALTGIDKSLESWKLLYHYLPDEESAFLEILGVLDRLRTEVEQAFPQARAFVRPGLDEG